jgi:hypothetical protein
MKKVELPEGCQYIGAGAFSSNNQLDTVILPSTLTAIHQEAFKGCTKIKHISIPEQDYAGRTITTVEARCLTYDGFYSSITIPKTVTSIGSKSIGWYYDDSYNAVKIKGLVIRGYSGTAAERYANSNGFRFFALDKNSLPSGDLNSDGKANASDASKILVAAARLGSGSSSGLSSSQTAAADANLDGTINASDAAMILVYAAKAGAGAFSGSFTSYLNSPMF